MTRSRKVICSICLLIIILFLCSVYIPYWIGSRRLKLRMKCGENFWSLGQAVMAYGNDHNKYPTPDKWCDLLLKDDYATIEQFKCPANKEASCGYGINPLCEPNSPPYVVLLFVTKGGWNLSGGKELITYEIHSYGEDDCYKATFVFFNDGHLEFMRQRGNSHLYWEADPNNPTETP